MALSIDGKFSHCWAMPETEGDVLDAIKNISICHHLESTESPVCVIESVHAMPGQGVTSMFTFGRGYGFLLGVLMSHSFKIVTVTPQRWQKELGLGKSEGDKPAWKRKLKAKAEQLYPTAKVTLKTADALLMLECGKNL